MGSQVASYSVKINIYTCESEIKFSDGLKVQKDTGIKSFLALNKVEDKEDLEKEE